MELHNIFKSNYRYTEMKAIRLLATSLLVALSMGVSSCENEKIPTDTIISNGVYDEIDKLFAQYIKNYSHIKCRFSLQKENTVLLSGLKDKHLWFSEYDVATKQLKSEWTNLEETDTILNINQGYGEYETVKLIAFWPEFYKKTRTGNIVTLHLLYDQSDYPISSSPRRFFQTIFTFNKQSKPTELTLDRNDIAIDWYAESVFVGNYCYSNEGKVIYEAKEAPQLYKKEEVISYEEDICIELRGGKNIIRRYNYKNSKIIWSTDLPFDIPSDAKFSYSLDNSTNVWSYQCKVWFYDGSKNEFTFKIDIDSGEIINDITDNALK